MAHARRRQGALLELPIQVDPRAAALEGMSAIHRLAARNGLSAYDAQYLELALRLRLPLATLDKALARAAQSAQVPLGLEIPRR